MSLEAQGRAAAERFREEHHLGVQPLGDLVALIEQATGIEVAVLEVGPDEHGMMMRDTLRDAVFIGVARTRNPMRQRSTLAHELGHVLFGDWNEEPAGGWSAHSPRETRANTFARHLLMPLDGVEEFLADRGPVERSTLSALVQRFLVSPPIAAIALHQAGRIDAATKEEWRHVRTLSLAVQFGWSDQYQALQEDSDRRRAPQRLMARAISAFEAGVLSARTIANLRGISVEAVEEELAKAGVVPRRAPLEWGSGSDLPAVDVDLDALDRDLGESDEDVEDHERSVRDDG